MAPTPFYGDSDGPDLVVYTADDGTPLTDLRGWTCGGCDRLFATAGAAEWCCVGPDAVVLFPAVG